MKYLNVDIRNMFFKNIDNEISLIIETEENGVAAMPLSPGEMLDFLGKFENYHALKLVRLILDDENPTVVGIAHITKPIEFLFDRKDTDDNT